MKTARLIVSIVVVAFLAISTISFSQTTSASSGDWSNANTWVSGVVPTANDNVVIASGTTVTVDIQNAVCKDLLIDGTLTFPNVNGNGITINGNVSVSATGKFNTYSTGNPTGTIYQYINIYGDLTVASGGNFDMRRGSNPNVSCGRVVFTGSTNTNISLSQTSFGSSIEEFNSVVIDKSNGAKVILTAGNLFMTNNSSTAGDTLVFINGLIETGNNIWVNLATTSKATYGGSSASYVNGNFGRGMSNSGAAQRTFEVGDAQGYRPITVQANTAGSTTGHYLWVSVVHADANTGSSTLQGGISSVSGVRYYNVGYVKSSAATMTLSVFSPSYGSDDGFSNGDTDIRVAYSTDNRVTWNGIPQTELHTVDLTNPPVFIRPDSLTSLITLADGAQMQVALAHATSTGLNDVNYAPASYNLKQNYPNPFNPSTQISFDIAKSGNVKLTIYNILGEQVGQLVNGYMEAGSHIVNFNASNLVSGVYMYKIESGNFVQVRKMVLLK